MISYVLERPDRLDELTPQLTADDRHHARTQLESRRAALTTKLRDALKRAYGVASPDDADLGARAEDHIMALDSRLDIRPPAGLGLGDALQRICGQLLEHAYPKHPDFDPQGKRQVVQQDRADHRAARRRTAPCRTRSAGWRCPRATCRCCAGSPTRWRSPPSARSSCSGDEWKLMIDRKAGQVGPTADLKVADIRRWIAEEQPGLPELVVDLLVACYAVQADRAWIRAGQPIPPPDLGRITPDMVLRRPGTARPRRSSRLANERAASVFGLARQPVRSARAVQALAEEMRRRAGSCCRAAESLVQRTRGARRDARAGRRNAPARPPPGRPRSCSTS